MKETNAVTVLFFYCKYSDAQKSSLTAVWRSILAQMIKRKEEVLSFVYDKVRLLLLSPAVRPFYFKISDSSTVQLASSSEATLDSKLLKELVEVSLQSCAKVIIVLDGLDECAPDEEKRITAWILGILQRLNEDNPGSLRALLISQRDAALERLLRSVPVISLDTQEHQKDIEAYCLSWMPLMKEKFEIPTARADQIATSVAAQADGGFLNLLFFQDLWSANF